MNRRPVNTWPVLIPVLLAVFACASAATPIVCTTKGNNTVVVEMTVPHPKEAIVYRPGGTIVWLQAYDQMAHEQIENFALLEKWTITPSTQGTVYIDGVPTVEPVIKEKGRYHLYIAENTETEKENTYFIECDFDIRE